MRRKSERTASKKANPSPEKKVEKAKRTRTRRRKQSTSSENDSAAESSPVRKVEKVPEPEKKPLQVPIKEKEDSPEETPDQVWQVKTTDAGDVGEIQKLKICLTRPPSTPERVDRSPRSRRKHSRATSSSDTPSVEPPEDKKKSKHRSKRSRESKDDSEKLQDSQGDEIDADSEVPTNKEKIASEVSQSDTAQGTSSVEVETPMSTTNDENKTIDNASTVESSQEAEQSSVTKEDVKTTDSEIKGKNNTSDDADTTVASPKSETTVVSQEIDAVTPKPDTEDKQPELNTSNDKSPESPVCKRSGSVDKSEVLELHAEENRIESPVKEVSKIEEENVKEDNTPPEVAVEAADNAEVSNTDDKSISNETETVIQESNKDIDDSGVVDIPDNSEKPPRKELSDSQKDEVDEKINKNSEKEQEIHINKVLDISDSTPSSHEEIVHNGQTAPIVINRKRRWGSRATKLTTQKSITISTDILKDIIPDVKPVEFDEVIEEKKHKRIDASEKLERPVLPKIVIDNTENVELNKKDHDVKDRDVVKAKETNLASNRKISIVKDNDSIIARPPSPPRHKQSCILYITNLVRPFTLTQLKNLLQRTGRIAENGFWIDKIKSKCYVQYETEDQAVETRHALHGVTWPVSNPKTLQVDFSSDEAFDKAKLNEDTDNPQASATAGTVEDWLREQDLKRERGELDKPWERKAVMREWDVGKNEKDKDKDSEKLRRDERPMDKRRHRTPERSPEPARKFKKKEEEAPAKLLDDLFKKTKATPCIYWLPLSVDTIAVKEAQRRVHMAEHERRLQEIRRTHRRH